MYEYKMVQIPHDLRIPEEKQETFAADILQNIVHTNTTDGWEFYRVDYMSFSVQVSGGSPGIILYSNGPSPVGVVSFRREKPTE